MIAAIRCSLARTPQPLDLTPYRGNWVAVKDGRLIGHAPTAREIIDEMARLGPTGRGTTLWYEAHPEEIKRWGVMDERGLVGPNCYFDTEDAARRWRDSWHEGTVVTRDGQHDSWRPVVIKTERLI